MRHGFPPTPDRIFYRRCPVGAGVLVLVAIADIAYLFSISPNFFNSSDDFKPTPFREKEAPEVDREQTERDFAFKEVQRAIVYRLGPESLQEIEWLDRRHEGHRGWYFYEGRLRVMDWKERERIFEYTVTLELNPDDEWKILSIAVE